MKNRKYNIDSFGLTRIIITATLVLLFLLFSSQRSPVDLRDSTEINRIRVIIVECECTCDTIPNIDTIPL
jgi:hypothetical protein